MLEEELNTLPEKKNTSIPSYCFDERMERFLSMKAQDTTPILTVRDRNVLQQNALKLLLQSHNLILEWGTGVGKSRVAVLAVKELWRRGFRKMILLVAEKDHKRNWRDEFIKALGDEGRVLFEGLTVECYQSLVKYKDSEWDFLIADEAHHLRSDDRLEQLSSLRGNYVLCISATLDDRGDGEKLKGVLASTFGPFESVRFTVRQGIKSGFIGEPKLYVHLLSLDRITGEQKITMRWGRPDERVPMTCSALQYPLLVADREMYPDVEVQVTGTASELYNILNDEMDALKKEIQKKTKDAAFIGGKRADGIMRGVSFLQMRQKLLGNQRKTLLGECKTDYTKRLLRRLGDKKCIVFSTNVEQGEFFGEKQIVSSKQTSKKNEGIIRNFNEASGGKLFAVGMLREGTNLNGIQCGVIVQLGNKEREFIQKFGRTLRADSPVQHLIVMDGTKDVDYFFSSINDIDANYIKVIRGVA